MSVPIWKSRFDRALEVLHSAGAEVGAGASSVSLPPVALADAERELGRPIPLSIRSLLAEPTLQGHWQLPDVFEERMPAESCGVLWGGVDLTVQEVLAAETSRRSWLTECFPNPSDPYDAVWHGKFAFHTIANGDFLSIADSDAGGPVYYLSHDDGEGHGLQLAPSILEFFDRWSRLAFAGPEDWLLLPFVADNNALDAFGIAAHNWRRALGLEDLGIV